MTFDHARARWARLLSLLAVLALFAAACTGGDEDDSAEEDGSEQPADEGGEESEGGAPAEGGGDSEETARVWLADTYGLDSAVIDGLEVAETTTTMGIDHVRFVQKIDDVEVLGGEITVHILESGEVQTATDDLVDTTTVGEATPAVDEAGAIDTATKAVTGTPEESPEAKLVWLRNGETLQLAWQVEVSTTEPVSAWTVVVDAAEGTVITADEHEPERVSYLPSYMGQAAMARARHDAKPATEVAQASGDVCDAPAPGACLWSSVGGVLPAPDPIYAAGGDLTDPTQANNFLAPVELQGQEDPTALVGEFANAEPPSAPLEPVHEDDGTWAGGRASPGFENAMAYYWIDRTQRHIQSLGFTDILNEPFPIIPIDPDVVDNAFYSSAEHQIHMGVGSDGINESEDASGIVHEYGHAVLDAQAPALLGSVEGGAYHESFGDILAFLTTLPERNGDAGCLFGWPEEFQCLRRVDSPKVYPDDLIYEVHADGEIYNGAIYSVTEALLANEGLDIAACPGTQDCNAVLDRVLGLTLLGNTYLPNDPSLPDVAATFILANQAAYGGENEDIITAAFAEHGLSGGGRGIVDAGGEEMVDPITTGEVTVSIDITHSYRGDLDVRVGVINENFEDLCEPIQVFTPDEQDGEDDLFGSLDVSDSDCAGLVPPSHEAIWYLQVIDTLAEDEGQINGFQVDVGGVPYLAAGLPLPIADANPDGTFVAIDGEGTEMMPEGSSEFGGEVSGTGPILTAAITHTYNGDLDISAGVVDTEANIVCSVQVLSPDASNDADGLSGDVDMSGCADFYPPSPENRWYLLVIDTAAADTGTVDQFSLIGGDGQSFDFAGVPVEIPDDNVDGVALLLDGSRGSEGSAGGGGATGAISAHVSMTHPYQGDLAVTAGVADSEGNILCEVAVSSPDSSNDADNLDVEVSMADCARYYPPAPEQPWYLFVADTLEADTGTVDEFVLTGPDGVVYPASGVPLDVPDADPTGVSLLIDGSTGMGGGGAPPPTGGDEVLAVINVAHTFIGDLVVSTGVADGSGNIVCEAAVPQTEASDDGDTLDLVVPLGECSGFFPPSPDAIFYLTVSDIAAVDTGQITNFGLVAPDGTQFISPNVPADIPDDDPNGVTIGITG